MEQGKGIINDKDPQHTKDRKLRNFLKILVIVLAVHIIWSYTGTFFYFLILKTDTTKSTNVNRYIETKGLLGFQEKVVVSSQGGNLTWLHSEGDMVAVGTRLAKITGPGGEEEILTSPVPGIFSTQVDGLEGTVYPHRDWVPEKDVFLSLKPASQGFQTGEEVPAGSPLFKVVQNFTWYYSAVLSQNEMALLDEARRLSLEFDFNGSTYPVESLKRHDLGDGYTFLVLSLTRDAGDFYRRRWEEARIIYGLEEGVLVPASAIVNRKGQTGIYRYVRSAIAFVEVEIIHELKEERRFVVSGLEPNWLIVTNPRFFREGQRFL